MGFLDHTTNNIIVDAVLTDKGREKLASANGLKIIQYAFADTEVDYTLLKKYGEIVGKEKIEKNTPIFEADTRGSIEAKHSLLMDSSGSSIGNITITPAPSNGSTTVYKYTLDFSGFDPNQNLVATIVFTSSHWSLTSAGQFSNGAPSPVGDPAGMLSTVTYSGVTANGSGEYSTTIEFTLGTTTGDYTASFSVRDQSGVFSGVVKESFEA